MDFFGAQDAARRKTLRLVLLFSCAVIALIVLTNLLFAGALYGLKGLVPVVAYNPSLREISDSQWIWITLMVAGGVGIASGYKYMTLRDGGRTVAERMNARLLAPGSNGRAERRLLNVVEEMSIAAGIGVPPVYVLPDPTINAFAAGLTTDDAVLGVTQGTLELLSRDELQGVVGHELSHILNGDTRINMRLVALLHGILFIGLVGRGLLYGGHSNRRSSAPLALFACALIGLGAIGTFMGSLIKAGINRQREYLADASSVQFTRNADGIAGALKKIGGLSSHLTSPRSREISHMFFGRAFRPRLTSLLATHPSLPLRIRAVDPRWDGEYAIAKLAAHGDDPSVRADQTQTLASRDPLDAAGEPLAFTDEPSALSTEPLASSAEPLDFIDEPGTSTAGDKTTRPMDSVDANAEVATDDTVETARELVQTTDMLLRDAARDPWGARALVYAMLIHRESGTQTREAQIDHVRQHADPGVPRFFERLLDSVATTDKQRRLVLVELAMPALKQLSTTQYRSFRETVARLVTIDPGIELFDWVLYRVLIKELQPHFGRPLDTSHRYRRRGEVDRDALAVIAELAKTAGGPANARQAYEAGAHRLGLPAGTFAPTSVDLKMLGRSLNRLRALKPLSKPKLIKACMAAVSVDDRLTDDEFVLIRGIGAALDCPIPPLLD